MRCLFSRAGPLIFIVLATGSLNAAEAPKLSDSRAHWAFQPVKEPRIPEVRNEAWIKSPIDPFILQKLEERGWMPAPEARKTEWIRRVYFDVIGLPPSPEEVRAFLADESPKAWERIVERLLSNPHYGEKWGQHWLDVIRYAETEGYEYDRHLPDAWRFRDYVIQSFNQDKPFDRFVMEQLAGDELDAENRECLTASTFHRLGPVRRNAGNPEIALSRNEVLTERTDIIGSAFLGLSVGCARCHNHKLEPILQKDYYSLQAYLAATDEHNVSLASSEEQKDWETKTKGLTEEIKQLREQNKTAQGEGRMRLTRQIEDLEAKLPPALATIPATRNDFKQRTEIHVLKRGEWEKKGEVATPRPPSVLVSEDFPDNPAGLPNPRTSLARWLTDPAHPLTARVIVNRIWQNHFGEGLVRTVNDFGVAGERPSHPELLDWLAAQLVNNGWHLKSIHRLILLSATYRQSSAPSASSEVKSSDPENRLLSRFNRRRLTAEELRDAMLAVSGRLNLECGGPSVMIPVEPDLVKLLYKPSQWSPAADPKAHDRRSIYMVAKRNLRLPFMEMYDAPALLTSCARRESSTHAPQALEMLNGKLSNDLAASFAQRLHSETDGTPDALIERAYWLTTARAPTAEERRLSRDFLREQSPTEFALAIFNLNAFLYVQ